jgi:chromate transporter
VAIEISAAPAVAGASPSFPAGYYNVEGGLAWGLLGATIANLCTFVPSFVFIINGAPIIDRIRTTGAFAAWLNGITIGVVGVIAGLAVFVARHAAFTDGEPDWLVITLAAAAFVAARRVRVGVIPIVSFCAAVGLTAALVNRA